MLMDEVAEWSSVLSASVNMLMDEVAVVQCFISLSQYADG
jgi:hypothetical protein